MNFKNFALGALRTNTRVFSPARVFINPGRFFSAAPEPLTVQEIENRVLDTLKSFSKVNQEKVVYFPYSRLN